MRWSGIPISQNFHCISMSLHRALFHSFCGRQHSIKIWTTSSLSIQLLMDTEVASLSWLLWTALQWTLGSRYLSELYFTPDTCPVGLLDRMATLVLVFWETSILSPIVATPTYIPTTVCHTLFSAPSSAFICRLSEDGHSDWSEVVPHCTSDLHCSNNYRHWTPFHVPAGHLYIFFGEISI